MITLHERSRQGRREFLRIGSLGLGGLTLSQFMGLQAHANSASLLRDKSVVFLFMHGGPSQFETFDPKMHAPREIRSATGEVATTLPGITFGGNLPKLAGWAHKLAVVRSFTTGDSRHDIKPIVHADTFNANVGSLYARIAGTNHPQFGIPRNVALYPRAVSEEAMPAVTQFGNFGATGSFASSLTPFAPGADGKLQEDMSLNVPLRRLDDRRTLLTEIDGLKRELEREERFARQDALRQQAFDALAGGMAEAFDLSREDPRLLARYDTSKLVTPEQISKKWNNHQRYADNGQTLGKLLLLARRLCERGAGFVTVTTNFVWDMHADKNNAGVEEGMGYMGVPFDHAVSAFLEDIHQKGLDDKILLVCCGEMGRTPRINKNGGRDHWGGLAPLILAGGGLNMGQVIGESDKDGGKPKTNPITIKHLVATILRTLMNPGELRLMTDAPREIIQAGSEWDPIPGLA